MASTFTALNPEGYEKIMGRFSRRLSRAFIDFTGAAPGETILDVGCGTGSMTAALAERGDHSAIVGIDVSQPYVAFARARNKDPRITFDIGDATSLPYPSGHFPRRRRDAPGRATGRHGGRLRVGRLRWPAARPDAVGHGVGARSRQVAQPFPAAQHSR